MAILSGLGLAAPRETDTAPAAAAAVPAQNPLISAGNALQGTTSRSGAPSFQNNPLGAIGLVLSNFSAGLRGDELPTERIRRDMLAQRQVELQQLRATMDVVAQGVELFGGLDPDDPRTPEAIDRYIAPFIETLGENVGPALNTALEVNRTRSRSLIDGMLEHQERAYNHCGLDFACLKDVISDEALLNRWNETADRERMPGITAKFQAMTQAVGGDAQLKELARDGWTLVDLQSLPPGWAFTDEELITIARNEDIQNGLIPFGFRPPDLSRFAEQERIRQQAAAGSRAPPAESPIAKLQRERGEAEAEGRFEDAEEIQSQITTIGTVTGTTEFDPGTRPSEKEAEEAGESARLGAANIATYSTLLTEIERLGAGAGGVRGAVGEFGGGLLSQLNRGLGAGFTEFVTGVSEEELQNVRTRSVAMVARSVEQFTAEESGRITKEEREITNDALRLLQPGASFPQIRAAMGLMVALEYTHRDLNEQRAGFPVRHDMSTDDGMRALLRELLLLGLNGTEARQARDQIQLQRRLVGESGGAAF